MLSVKKKKKKNPVDYVAVNIFVFISNHEKMFLPTGFCVKLLKTTKKNLKEYLHCST